MSGATTSLELSVAATACRLRPEQWQRVRIVLVALALFGWVTSAWGWSQDTQQFHASYLVSFLYVATIGLGATLFVAIQHLTTAAWSVTSRRLMESIMITVLAAPALFIPVIRGLDVLYRWAQPGFFDPDDPNVAFKRVFFSPTFYESRMVVYFVVWCVLAWLLYQGSVGQDRHGGSMAAVVKLRRWSGPGVAALFVTVTSAAVDWVMSLEPYWYSTVFGIYVFAGGAVAFVAAIIILALGLRALGYLREWIHVEHYHDWGKWLFALSVFWAYLAYSQYMLMWYANLPEETAWYQVRLNGSWRWVSLTLAAGHFGVPFLGLMARRAKRSLPWLGAIAGWMLLMHWVDLHWLVMPTVHEHGFHLHWLDLSTWLAVGATAALVGWWVMGRHPLVPAGDLRLAESLEHHNE